MEKFAIYGKGGIGKSTISSNLSAQLAKSGLKTLQVGCDPKRDSTRKLLGGKKIPTVLEMLDKGATFRSVADFVTTGFAGIHCVEAGGPLPGTGCAGRGIARMFEVFDDVSLLSEKYDAVLFDVLGDVVCGGFASPLRLGYGEKVFIVISEEVMSMYACNNICRAVKTYASNGIYVGGIIVNMRDNALDRAVIEKFVDRLGLEVAAVIPRSEVLAHAEYRQMTAAEFAPDSDISKAFSALAHKILATKRGPRSMPTPMDDDEFDAFFRSFELTTTRP